ncbi:MAG: hypothetical protein WC729_09510 [Sphingomonas sp.]|jgi:hypothetical protein
MTTGHDQSFARAGAGKGIRGEAATMSAIGHRPGKMSLHPQRRPKRLNRSTATSIGLARQIVERCAITRRD